MTPIPKPKRKTTIVLPANAPVTRVRHNMQMTSTQYLLWKARRRPAAPPRRDTLPEMVDKIKATPGTGDTITAKAGATPADEVDSGFYNALLQKPAVVGNDHGQVPMSVVRRLYLAGLVEVVRG